MPTGDGQTISRPQIQRWFEIAALRLAENQDYLTELDAAIGDADHGTNIARGFAVVAQKTPSVANQDVGAIFKLAGMTLMSSVGGASGILYGTFFLRAAAVTGGKLELSADDLAAALQAGVDGIIQRGRCAPGEKTMLDAWAPALDALQEQIAAGATLSTALASAVAAAANGMRATTPMLAQKGRASYLGERSIGHQDPGATSAELILRALLEATQP